MRRVGLAAFALLVLLPLGSAVAASAAGPAKPAAAKPAAAKTAPAAVPAPAAKPANSAAPKAVTPAPPATPARALPPPSACVPPPPSKEANVFRDCQDSPEMVRLAGGSFQMGELGTSAHTFELPVHDVTVRPFAIGRYEVTWIEWLQCVRSRACTTTPDDHGWGRGYRPVVGVSWYDAQEFAAWMSRRTGKVYRLPSEAEWEYAARGGTQSTWSWGDASFDACENANSLDLSGQHSHPNWFWNIYCDDGFDHTAPVGSFKANPFGLYDMHGNLWEWVQDCWHGDYTGAPADGSAWIAGGDCDKRVNRGGGWSNNPRSLRSANRDADVARHSGDAFGFRIARELEPAPAGAPAPVAGPPAAPAAAGATASPASPTTAPAPRTTTPSSPAVAPSSAVPARPAGQ